MIVKKFTLGKPSEPIRDNLNPGKVLLITQQKLDNLQQQLEDETINSKVPERKKWMSQIVKLNKNKMK